MTSQRFLGAFAALNSYSGGEATERPLALAAAKLAMASLASTIRDAGLAEEKFEGCDGKIMVRLKLWIAVEKNFKWLGV